MKSDVQALVTSPDLKSEANDQYCANLGMKVNATW
jgi:hypothetical protein